MATDDEWQERLERAARKLDYTDYPDEAATVREAVDLLADVATEVARLDKQLLAARRVTLTDADGRPDDAALVRQLEAAAREVDSSLLECAALRLKRALAEVARRDEEIAGLRRERDEAAEFRDECGTQWLMARAENGRLRAAAEAALRLCPVCGGLGHAPVDNPYGYGWAAPAECPACGPIRRALDAADASAGGPEDSGEGRDA